MGLSKIFKPLSIVHFPVQLINFSNFMIFSPEIFWERWELNSGQLAPDTMMLTIVICCPPLLVNALGGRHCTIEVFALPTCRVEPEVDQATGSTSLQEVDQQTGSAIIHGHLISVLCT